MCLKEQTEFCLLFQTTNGILLAVPKQQTCKPKSIRFHPTLAAMHSPVCARHHRTVYTDKGSEKCVNRLLNGTLATAPTTNISQAVQFPTGVTKCTECLICYTI